MPARRALRLLVVLLLTSATACTVATDEAPTPTPSPTAAGTPDGSVGFSAIPDIVSEVQPSIVSVNVTVERQGRTGQGAGSGVVWSSDGVIVTNNHVVAEATEIEVVLANGSRHAAEVMAADPVTDLAVLRADVSGLPAATFADRLPVVGELAVALGNPLGFQNSATAGIVSGLDRSLPASAGGATLVGLIQTDAPISSGNSGGALVDQAGEVIGVNVAALGAAEARAQGQITAENVGFAIPSTTVIGVVEQLLADGDVSHPYLGIRGATLTPQIAERFGIEADAGVLVAEVVPGGPADEAGVQGGDLIIGLAGSEVRSFGDLAGILRDHEVGDTVELTVVRDGEEQVLDLTLAELPERGATP